MLEIEVMQIENIEALSIILYMWRIFKKDLKLYLIF